VARVGTPSYNCNKVTKINLRNIWWIVKNLYIWLLFNQNTNTMEQLRDFEIYYKTEFGIGLFHLKALSFNDAFKRLKEKYKRTLIEIHSVELNETLYREHFIF
jgi:hypothetical protein